MTLRSRSIGLLLGGLAGCGGGSDPSGPGGGGSTTDAAQDAAGQDAAEAGDAGADVADGGGSDADAEGGCSPGATQCAGDEVQTCDSSGQWGAPSACIDQVCAGSACQGECAPGGVRCSGNGVQTCDATGHWGIAAACPPSTPSCASGACGLPASCAGGATGAGNDCGPAGDAGCCTSPAVTGGSFSRSYDGVSSGYTDAQYAATVSDFRLDAFEITVGRFRAFVDAVVGGWTPAAGAGKHAHLGAGSGLGDGNGGYEPGWDVAWNVNLPAAKSTWDGDTGLGCNAGYQTWTSAAGSNERRPINCATWFEVEAFCIWDGGFLPSEAEWNYAAAGGAEQRVYPWSSPASETTIDCSHANLFATTYCNASFAVDVGSQSPLGDGKWGQSDLAGNTSEWVTDAYQSPYGATQCSDCASQASPALRVYRGGSFDNVAPYLLASSRGYNAPSGRSYSLGARCARMP